MRTLRTRSRSSLVAAFGIVGMGIDILGRKKQKARDD